MTELARVARIVALASASGKYGGPFDTSMRQAELALRMGFSPRVIAGSFPGDELDPTEAVVTRPVRHLLGLRSYADVGSLRAVALVLRAVHGSQLVHLSLAREALPLFGVAAARLLRRPLILQPHGMLTSRSSLTHRLLDFLIVRPLLGRTAHVIALSEREKSELLAWDPRLDGRVEVVANPPALGLEGHATASDPERSVALFAARLHPRKRVLDFAEAARISERNGWRSKFAVLGPDEGELESLLTVGRDTENLEYRGATDSAGVIEALRSTGVFVLPSFNEPWGNVVVAALKLGVPVVITRSSVLAPLIEQAGAGIVVSDGAPHEIASAVDTIMDPGAWVRFSGRARDLGQSQFGEHEAAEALAVVYRRARGR